MEELHPLKHWYPLIILHDYCFLLILRVSCGVKGENFGMETREEKSSTCSVKSRRGLDAGVGAVISTVAPYVDRQSLLYGARPLLIVYFGYATFSCLPLSHKITVGLSYSEKTHYCQCVDSFK